MIYIIDDDQYVRRAFVLLLNSAGYQTNAFGTAEEFLENVKPSGSDLILLDYHMPGLSGCDLLEHFKKNSLHYPVIIITAFEDEESRKCAKKYGALAYLRKPVDGEALIDLVKYSVNLVKH